MLTRTKVLLLILLLAIFASFGLLSSAQQRPSSAVGTATDGDLPLFLDGEPVGTVANIRPLTAKLSVVLRKHTQSSHLGANAPDGSIPITGRVVFVPDEGMSLLHFGQISEAVQTLFDYDWSRKLVLFNKSGCGGVPSPKSKPDPANIVLSTRPFTPDELANMGVGEKCWFDTSVKIATTPRLLKSYRVSTTSIEIADDGSYFVNEQMPNAPPRIGPDANWSVSSNRILDAAPLKRRPIDTASLKTEVNAWVEKRTAEYNAEWRKMGEDIPAESATSQPSYIYHGPLELLIIVSGKPSYSSLERVLGLIGRSTISVTIVVNASAGR